VIRIAEIKQLEFVGQLGRIRVQFQDPASTDVENGVLILPTGDNVCPSVGDSCYVLCVGDEYGMNYVIPYDIDNAPKILEGEKIIYGKKQNQIYFKQDGSISIATADGKQLDIAAQGGLNVTGDVVITGNLSVSGTSNLQGATTIETKPFITHTHSGVTVGAGITGGVV
jgi:hypothetical protein